MKIATLYLAIAAALALPLTSVRADDKKGDPIINSLAATSAQAVFSTYFAVAELGDLYGAKAYDAQKCTQIAGTYVKLTENAKDSLTDLIDSGKLSETDVASARELVIINDLLGKTATGIVEYVKTPNDENLGTYNKNREKAWKSISKFLGLGDG
jgi:hypothetical protein